MRFGLDFIRKLRPCQWRYNTPSLDDGRKHLGFIAQQVDELASHLEYGFVDKQPGEEGLYSLNMYEFIGPIVKALQELDERIAKLEER